MLEVSYEAPAAVSTTTVSLQQNMNGYTGSTMSRIDQDGTVEDGSLIDESFLDGEPIFAGGTDEDQALLKFDNIFVSQGGSVPDSATILDAQLVLTSARSGFSTASGTTGSFAAHQMLVPWDLTTAFADFGGDGPTIADGEIGPALDLTGALLFDSETTLDVTDAVAAWQSGAPNYGFSIQSYDTIDGWALTWNGAFDPADAPELLITYTTDPIVSEDADFDADGDVDMADLMTWQRGFGLSSGASLGDGDANNDGAVDAADLAILKDQFGNMTVSALGAVPEPSAAMLLVVGAMLGLARRRS